MQAGSGWDGIVAQEFPSETIEKASAAESLTTICGSWYALYTKSRNEKLVHQNLRQRGLDSFLPVRDVLSQWQDRRKWVQKPLFPGYLFVRVQQEDLYNVSAVRGVVHVLGSGCDPIPVPEEQVQAVRKMIEGPYPVVPWPWLQKGKRVRVTAGPLAGLETYIVKRKDNRKCQLVVTVDILGRSVSVEIDPGCVEVL